jgi:hypothetical protein
MDISNVILQSQEFERLSPPENLIKIKGVIEL